MFRGLAHAFGFLVVQDWVMRVNVDLRAGLMIAGGSVLFQLSVEVFPFHAIVALHSLPLIMIYPDFEVDAVDLVSHRRVNFRVAHVVCDVVPR